MEINVLSTKNRPTIQEAVMDEKELNFEYEDEIQFLKAQKLTPSQEVINAIFAVLKETKAKG